MRKREGPSFERNQRGCNTVRRSPLQCESQPAGSALPQTAGLLKTTRSGSAGSSWVIALWIPKAGRARKTPPTSSDVAHSSYAERQPGAGRSRHDSRLLTPGQFGTASPKSAI